MTGEFQAAKAGAFDLPVKSTKKCPPTPSAVRMLRKPRVYRMLLEMEPERGGPGALTAVAFLHHPFYGDRFSLEPTGQMCEGVAVSRARAVKELTAAMYAQVLIWRLEFLSYQAEAELDQAQVWARVLEILMQRCAFGARSPEERALLERMQRIEPPEVIIEVGVDGMLIKRTKLTDDHHQLYRKYGQLLGRLEAEVDKNA
jgi:hypothetical protein